MRPNLPSRFRVIPLLAWGATFLVAFQCVGEIASPGAGDPGEMISILPLKKYATERDAIERDRPPGRLPVDLEIIPEKKSSKKDGTEVYNISPPLTRFDLCANGACVRAIYRGDRRGGRSYSVPNPRRLSQMP
jgi:hypothetical protein